MPDTREEAGGNPASYRNRTTAMWVLLLLVLAAALGVTLWDHSRHAGQAPGFTLIDTGMRDGVLGEPQTFSLDDYQGQVLVIDFMAVNCAPCRVMSDRVMAPLYDTYRDDPRVELLAVNVWAGQLGETVEETLRLQMAQRGDREPAEPWRHALDTDDVLRKYGTYSIPQLAIIDPDGRVVYNRAGIPAFTDVDATIQAALAGDAQPVPFLQVGLVGLAFVAGLAAFFAPCSVALLPAYLGFLLHGQQGLRRRDVVAASVRGGLATAAGIVGVYALIALLLWALRDALLANLRWLAPSVALLLIAFAVMLFLGAGWTRGATMLGLGRVDARRGFFAFGVAYGLAAFACTGPVFLPILVAAFAQGAGTGAAAFAAYTLAVAAFVVLAAGLVAQGRQTRLRRILAHTRAIQRTSALLLAGAGVYLLWFYARAYEFL